MATRKEEKERRRQERLEQERREGEQARRRLILGYVAAGILAAAVLAGIVVLVIGGGDGGDEGGGGGENPANAHINEISGSPNGVTPDGREGTPPPEVQQADLDKAAGEAGCELQLDLPDEGNSHISPKAPTPDYDTNPPTSGDHA